MSKRLLLTGGAGGVGAFVARRFAENGISVRVFDLPTDNNKKVFRSGDKNIETYWGDITDPTTVREAMKGIDEVFHLAAIVPPATENNPDLALKVNVGGTKNVADAALTESKASGRDIILRFSSSVTVYGKTHNLTPPVPADHPVSPNDYYSRSKVEAEKIVKESGLPWTIFRFAAAIYLDVRMSRFSQMRVIPPDNRIEFVHIHDVATALLNSIGNPETLNKTFTLGGGPGCQMLYREQIGKTFSFLGFPAPNWSKFASEPYNLDWYNTTESQRVLKFQARGYDDYLEDLKKSLGVKFYLFRYTAGPLMKIFRIHV